MDNALFGRETLATKLRGLPSLESDSHVGDVCLLLLSICCLNGVIVPG